MFYKLWHDAERGANEYIPTEVHWSQVPGRDAKWREQTIKNTSEQQFRVEFECEFLGSVDTLISPSKLRTMAYGDPITEKNGLALYKGVRKVINMSSRQMLLEEYQEIILVLLVVDTTTIPYQVVARYRNNDVKPILFPNIIVDVARNYNHAFVLVANDVGGQVADIIQYDLEYDNF